MAYPPITDLPTAPTLDSPTTFNQRSFSMVDAFATMIGEMNDLADYLDGLALATGPGNFTNIAATGTATAEAGLVAGTTGSDTGDLFLKSSDAGLGRILFGDATDDDVGQIYYDHSTNKMHFVAGTFEALTIEGSGDVGIGTNSPSGKLHIATDANVKLKLEDTDLSGVVDTIYINANGSVMNRQTAGNWDLWVGGDNTGAGWNRRYSFSDSALTLFASGSGDMYQRIGSGRTGDGNAYLDLVGDTTYSNYGTRLIRSGSATSILHHRGTGALRMNVADAGYFQINTDGTERMRVMHTSGYVGIGETNPAYNLHVAGAGATGIVVESVSGLTYDDAFMSFHNQQTGGNPFSDGLYVGFSDLAYWWNFENTATKFANNNAVVMTLAAGGDLGVGTETPETLLHVQKSNTSYTWPPASDHVAIFERSSDAIVDIVTDNLSKSTLRFSDNDSSGRGRIVYDHPTDGMEFFTNGSQKMFLGASGNLILNGTTALGKLTIYGDEADTYVNSDGRMLFIGHEVATNDAAIKLGQDRTGNGNTYVDFISDSTYTDYGLRIRRYNNGPNANSRIHHRGTAAMQFYNQEAASFTWWVSGSEVAQLRTDGTFAVATTIGDPGLTDGDIGCSMRYDGRFYSSATAPNVHNKEDSDGQVVQFRRDAVSVGSISVTSTTTSYNTSSDERRKDNIIPLQPALAYDKLRQLEPVEYDWKHNGEHQWGFIAQRHAVAFPQAVTPGELDEGGWQMDAASNDLIATLVAVIQDMSNRLENLEQKAA